MNMANMWRERGGPAVRSPRQRGFASRLLEQAVTYELQGQASLEFAPEGVRYEHRFENWLNAPVPLSPLAPH